MFHCSHIKHFTSKEKCYEVTVHLELKYVSYFVNQNRGALVVNKAYAMLKRKVRVLMFLCQIAKKLIPPQEFSNIVNLLTMCRS